ncbi:restriction endonuclease [bacterium]|nr:restriction endonuclease [bacterium]MBU1985107.1 restriction endonuclease [bacterium]
MTVAAMLSFNKGKETISQRHPGIIEEVTEIIETVDTLKLKTKVSKEKTMSGRMLYNPKAMNTVFKSEFKKRGWNALRVKCDYSTQHYVGGYAQDEFKRGAYREMDFIKDRVGVEVQFGKYSFMVYNVAAKMTIFHNLDHIDEGIEIVPVKTLAAEMSSGVSYFEQFEWDLRQRGVSNIDIPILILGIAK